MITRRAVFEGSANLNTFLHVCNMKASSSIFMRSMSTFTSWQLPLGKWMQGTEACCVANMPSFGEIPFLSSDRIISDFTLCGMLAVRSPRVVEHLGENG